MRSILPGLEESSSENYFYNPDQEFNARPSPTIVSDPFEKSARVYSLIFIFSATVLESFAFNNLVYAILPYVSRSPYFGPTGAALGTEPLFLVPCFSQHESECNFCRNNGDASPRADISGQPTDDHRWKQVCAF